MKYFLEPINLSEWFIFNEVCNFHFQESFLATKEMEIGDMLFLYVTNEDKEIPSGIYGNGIIISQPCLIYGERRVDVIINYIRFDNPILNFDVCIKYIKQFRSVHRIDDEIVNELLNTQLKNIMIRE